MAEKHLSEAAWKVQAKGQSYKDAAWLKSLEAWAKAAKAGPDEQRQALDQVATEAAALRKAHKADKALASYLDLVDKALERERKDVEKAAKAAADAEEADESPALLTSKMIPLVRQVRKGDTLHALIATNGKQTAVLLARRPVAPARRKLLAEFLDVSGTLKYLQGTCLWEQEAHTFVVDSQAAGLAKKLKAALLGQTELRCKVRVRGPDPNDVDEDLDDAAPAQAEPQASAAATGQPVSDDNAARLTTFNARLKALLPAVQAAVQAGHPQAAQIKLRASEAGALARQNRFAEAQALLDALAQQLAPAAAAPAAPAGPAATRKEGRFVNHAKARLAWLGMREKLKADLDTLEQAILAHYRDAANHGELKQKVKTLQRLLVELDSSLTDTLDLALNAQDMARRAELHEQAREILARYSDFATRDELLQALDTNPFVPLTTRDTLLKGLQVLDRSLA